MTEGKNETMAEFYKAFVKVQKALKPAKKESTNPHFRSKYADLSSCYDACKDVLSDNGFVVLQSTRQTDSGETLLDTMLAHTSGAHVGGSIFVCGKEATAQQRGSALTYARRYALITIVGLSSDDDDGNAASGKETKEKILDIDDPGDYPILFGPSKGKRIRQVSDKELESALKWCKENRKFPEFQAAVLIYLDNKTQTEVKKGANT